MLKTRSLQNLQSIRCPIFRNFSTFFISCFYKVISFFGLILTIHDRFCIFIQIRVFICSTISNQNLLSTLSYINFHIHSRSIFFKNILLSLIFKLIQLILSILSRIKLTLNFF